MITLISLDILYIIPIIFFAIILILGVLYGILHLKTKKKVNNFNDWFTALGGKENVIEASYRSSRLTILLNDVSLVDEEKLKSLNATNFIKASNKIILVVSNNIEQIADQLNQR